MSSTANCADEKDNPYVDQDDRDAAEGCLSNLKENDENTANL
jgi:hypothetical protein